MTPSVAKASRKASRSFAWYAATYASTAVCTCSGLGIGSPSPSILFDACAGTLMVTPRTHRCRLTRADPRETLHNMRVLVCGGGFVGTYAALRLERRLRGADDEIVLVNAENYLQYQPFLPDAASGTIEPLHVVHALRRVLCGTRLGVAWG